MIHITATSLITAYMQKLEAASTILLIGAPDRGKSTLLQKLLASNLNRDRMIGLIDADLGQNHLGPPTCIWAAVVSSTGYQVEYGYFVGSLSPAGYDRAMAGALSGALSRLRSLRVDHIVIDTPGLIFGTQGFQIQRTYIQSLTPSLVLAIERDGELEALLGYLGLSRHQGSLLRIQALQGVRRRSARERKASQRQALASYFREARLLDLSLSNTRAWFRGTPLSLEGLGRFCGHYGAFTGSLVPTLVQLTAVSGKSATIRYPRIGELPGEPLLVGALYQENDSLAHRPDLTDPSHLDLHFCGDR